MSARHPLVDAALVYGTVRVAGLWGAYRRAVGVENVSPGGFYRWNAQHQQLRQRQPRRSPTLATVAGGVMFTMGAALLSSAHSSGAAFVCSWGAIIALVVMLVSLQHRRPPFADVERINATHRINPPVVGRWSP